MPKTMFPNSGPRILDFPEADFWPGITFGLPVPRPKSRARKHGKSANCGKPTSRHSLDDGRILFSCIASRRIRFSSKEILMSTSAGTTSSASVYTTPAFWERLWRTAGIQSTFCFIVAYFVYGHQPQVGASADALAAFYDGDRMRILIAAVFYGLAVPNLILVAGLLRTPLAGAGQLGWAAA